MTEPPKAKSIYDFEFDITAIQSELLKIGTDMGLTVDSSLTPDNASWGNPVTASESFQGQRLENRLKDYVRSTPELIATYGGVEITHFYIFIEQIGNGSYRIYYLY